MEFSGASAKRRKGRRKSSSWRSSTTSPRHGYELTRLIEERSGGALTFNFASLYATAVQARGTQVDQGTLGGEGGPAARPLLQHHARRQRCARAQRKEWQQVFALIRGLAGVRYT